MWMNENRDRISRTLDTPIDFAVECGRQWRALSEDERNVWTKRATDARKAYQYQIDSFMERMKEESERDD